MADDVMVLAEHDEGVVADSTYELLGKARRLSDAWGGRVHAVLFGRPELAPGLGGADVVHVADHPALGDYLPEAYEAVLAQILAEVSPRLLLLATSTPGMDLGAALSVRWDAPLAAYVVALEVEAGAGGGGLVATAQIYAGKLMAEVEIGAPRAICTVIGGSWPADAGKGTGTPELHEVQPTGLDDLRSAFTARRLPEAAGVDITAAELLVSVGRGIASQDNLELVQELADALGAPLSASRPVIDQGWLPKAQQVGKSGQKVKPRAYLAFGISGAPEHLEGMRNSDLIIACNTDASAPIFDVAHYGTTADLFDLVPELVQRLGS
ncbi:MAG: electron transfer flavoprotein subunit alpha/FixB family protein [Acidimicrobiales bacterium]